MKIRKLILLLASSFVLLSCGGQPASSVTDSSVSSTGPTSSQNNSSNPTSNPASDPISSSPIGDSSEGSKGGSDGSKGASEGSTTISGDPTASSEPISSLPDIEPADDLRGYTIFDRAPEIHFTVDEGGVADQYANLKWATEPNKNTASKPKATGKLTLSNCDDKFALNDLKATMKVRGNYTSNYKKKPFQINFDKKQNMLGLNEGQKFKKWVLLADVKDCSMLRNALAFYLGGTLMEEQFCPDFTPVHLYLDNTYWGMYLLVDQKEVKTGRVEVAEPPEAAEGEEPYAGTDIGYFFEWDCYWTEERDKGEDGDPTFQWNTSDYVPEKITTRATDQGTLDDATGYTISSTITNRNTQVPFLKNHLKNCYTVIYDAVFNNKLEEIKTENGVESVVASELTDMEQVLAKTIDIDSFVNMYILNEICCDADIAHSSFYLSLDMSETGNKLLTLTNPWDWDSSLGIKQNVVENAQSMFASRSSNPWISMLTNTEWFMKKVQTRWQSLLQKGLFTKALRMMEEFSTKYSEDYAMNFQKWPQTMGQNSETSSEVRRDYWNCKTEADAYALTKTWVTTRFSYLTEMFNGEVPPDNYNNNGGTKGGQGGGGQGGGQTSQGSKAESSQGGGGAIISSAEAVDEGEAIARAEAFKQGKEKVVYEAEDATIVGGGEVKAPSESNVEKGEVVSGGKYVANLNPNAGITITFDIKNAKQDEALISLRISRRASDYRFNQFFSMTVNGIEPTSDEYLNITLAQSSQEERSTFGEYHCWTEWDIAITGLNAGDNTIVLTTKNACSNFDCLNIYQA